MSEEDHKKIGSYEDAFEKIKEETGVNSMQVIKNKKIELIKCFYVSTYLSKIYMI